MSFVNQAHPYTAAVVRREAPAASGVYGLSNSRQWIYVGETDDIRATLLDHLAAVSTPREFQQATGFSFETCVPQDRVIRQDRLVFELEPVRNRKPQL